jgi:hypothetical protein
MKQKDAKLRVCASCEWIFKNSNDTEKDCPKCGFGHYGARFVYGVNAYLYAKTQKPWFDKKMTDYSIKLRQEIDESKEITAGMAINFRRQHDRT